MAEVTLKKKITLRRKEEQAAFTFSGKLKVKLIWSSDTDLIYAYSLRKKTAQSVVYSLMNIEERNLT